MNQKLLIIIDSGLTPSGAETYKVDEKSVDLPIAVYVKEWYHFISKAGAESTGVAINGYIQHIASGNANFDEIAIIGPNDMHEQIGIDGSYTPDLTNEGALWELPNNSRLAHVPFFLDVNANQRIIVRERCNDYYMAGQQIVLRYGIGSAGSSNLDADSLEITSIGVAVVA